MIDCPRWIVLARLLRTQGRKGELLAECHTDFPERFEEQRRLFIAPPDFEGDATEARGVEVTSHWLPSGKNQGRIVLKFAGIDSINDAEPLRGLEVVVPQEERVALDEDATYISDLIGCTVFDGVTAVGIIEDVQFVTTPDGGRRMTETAPLLVLASPDGLEVLIPFARDFLVEVDTVAKWVKMNLPAGLLEVNGPREAKG